MEQQTSITDITDAMKNGDCIEMIIQDDKIYARNIPLDKIAILAQMNTESVYVICMLMRPGFALFSTKFEHKYFSPDEPDLECLFKTYYAKWNDLMFGILSFPISMKNKAIEMAKECGIALKEGLCQIMMVGGQGPQKFPVSGDNVLNAENTKDHWIYNNDRGEIQDHMFDEISEAKKVIKARGLTHS